MRARDAEHVASTISHGCCGFRALVDFRAEDRLAGILAELPTTSRATVAQAGHQGLEAPNLLGLGVI
jgi:hypothetical protein